MFKRNLPWAALMAASALALGCYSKSPRYTLENVNKDWNELIRASHIYPIYPLSQDVQPGDIFVTGTDINDTDFGKSRKGFLPLDQHLARIYPTGYLAFYTNTTQLNATNRLPLFYLSQNSWSNGLGAAFPSYSFTIQQGAAASVSLPIQGIPVGLSLMGAKKASGYVTISDSHTYGIDELSLRDQVQTFIEANARRIADALPVRNPNKSSDADEPAGKKATTEKKPNATSAKRRAGRATNAPAAGSTNQAKAAAASADAKSGDTNVHYLQIVTRVFNTGKVVVSLNNDDAVGGSLTGGAAKEAPLLNLETTNAASNYNALVSSVNSVLASNQLSAMAPGGSLKFSRVSSRSVAMDETFPKPVVIGYLGFCLTVTRKDLGDLAEKAARLDGISTMLSTDVGTAINNITNKTKEFTENLNDNQLTSYTNALTELKTALDAKRPLRNRLDARDRAVQNLQVIQSNPELTPTVRSNLNATLDELDLLPDDARQAENQGRLRSLSLPQLEKRIYKK
jgi:hypothetical protein